MGVGKIFGRDVQHDNRTKIGRAMFLAYFGSAVLVYTWHQEI